LEFIPGERLQEPRLHQLRAGAGERAVDGHARPAASSAAPLATHACAAWTLS
jgi:hypothetical protein